MTQATTYTHKYPEPLALLPNQIVTAEKLLDHIAERDVDLYEIVSNYLKKHYSSGCPSNFTGISEAIIEIVRKHPNLWYNSPNSICIGEYRVQGYEWIRFIWSIQNMIYYHFNPEGDTNDAGDTNDVNNEKTTSHVQTDKEKGYSPQLFQKFMLAVKKYVNSTDLVAEFMDSNPTDLTDFRQQLVNIVSEQDSVYPSMVLNFKEVDKTHFNSTVEELLNSLRPQIDQDQFKEFMSNTIINFVTTPSMEELKKSSVPLKAKIGKSKGLFYKYVASSEQFGPIFKMLTKYQKNKLNSYMQTTFESEFQEIQVTVEKEKSEENTDVPTIEQLAEASTEPFFTKKSLDEKFIEPLVLPQPASAEITDEDATFDKKKVTFKDVQDVFDNPAPLEVSSEEFQQIIDAFEGKKHGLPPSETPALKRVCVDANLSPASFELVEPPAPRRLDTNEVHNFNFSSEPKEIEKSREIDELTQAEKLV